MEINPSIPLSYTSNKEKNIIKSNINKISGFIQTFKNNSIFINQYNNNQLYQAYEKEVYLIQIKINEYKKLLQNENIFDSANINKIKNKLLEIISNSFYEIEKIDVFDNDNLIFYDKQIYDNEKKKIFRYNKNYKKVKVNTTNHKDPHTNKIISVYVNPYIKNNYINIYSSIEIDEKLKNLIFNLIENEFNLE